MPRHASLGLTETRFLDPTGLTAQNVSSARDLVKLVSAAHQYPLIREFSTSEEYEVALKGGRAHTFRNTNALVKKRRLERSACRKPATSARRAAAW